MSEPIVTEKKKSSLFDFAKNKTTLIAVICLVTAVVLRLLYNTVETFSDPLWDRLNFAISSGFSAGLVSAFFAWLWNSLVVDTLWLIACALPVAGIVFAKHKLGKWLLIAGFGLVAVLNFFSMFYKIYDMNFLSIVWWLFNAFLVLIFTAAFVLIALHYWNNGKWIPEKIKNIAIFAGAGSQIVIWGCLSVVAIINLFYGHSFWSMLGYWFGVSIFRVIMLAVLAGAFFYKPCQDALPENE